MLPGFSRQLRHAVSKNGEGLPLCRQKKSPTFPDEIAGNMSTKCTVIYSNSPWTSRM